MSDRTRARHRGVVYCVWTVLEGDPPTVVNVMVALLASVPLYSFSIRSIEATARKRQDVRSPAPAPHPGAEHPAEAGTAGPTAEPQHA